MRFWQKFSLKKLFFVLPTLMIFCCKQSLPNPNENFEKKYGKEIAKIKLERTLVLTKEEKKIAIQLPSPTQEEIEAINFANNQSYYPYVDITKFGQKIPQNNLPTQEFYEQSNTNNSANSLPENAFEISYNTGLYPPYRVLGSEFDQIIIPTQDVYGVQTKLSSKNYLLAGNKALQKSIDQINNEKTVEDLQNSELLIKEQKQLKQKQKMIQIFGSDDELKISEGSAKQKYSSEEKIVMQSLEEPKKNQNAFTDLVKKFQK